MLIPFAIVLSVSARLVPSQRAIAAFIEKQRELEGAPGLSAAVVRGGKVIFAGGAGFTNLENDVPARADTVYRLGSITKQFTATMIMQLVQEGRLSLDQTLGSVLPSSPTAWQPVTIRQLLSHTAGIPNYTNVPDFFPMVRRPVTPEHINDDVINKPLDFAPGSSWNYSNSGYVLLGLILEKIDRRTYGESLQKRILDPLDMSETYFDADVMVIKHRASGYSPAGKGFQNAPYIDMVWPFSAGAIESTVTDLAKWDLALYGSRILSSDSLNQMWTPVKTPSAAGPKYGFGWQLDTLNGVPLEFHGGGINGFRTFIIRAPSVSTSVIVLINSDGSDAEPIARRILGFVEPRLADKVAAIRDSDPDTTATIRKVFLALLDGRVESSLISQQMLSLLTPPEVAKMRSASDKWGRFESMTLVKSEDVDGQKHRSYVFKFENVQMKAEFVVGKTGKIEDARFHP